MEDSRRKPNRLTDYDYSSAGAYFITVCTREHKCLFWEDVGASIARPKEIRLSAFGKIVAQAICEIPKHYPAVQVDNYTVMPNHIHLLLRIDTDPDGRRIPAPTVSRVVQQMKGVITKQVGRPIWQKLFHDHVVRNDRDYQRIWKYIAGNPYRWKEDCFFVRDEAANEEME